MRPRAVVLIVLAALSGACDEAVSDRCAAAAGASATCEEACENLSRIDCRPAPTAEECVETCETKGAGLPAEMRDRTLACYSAAETCGEVEGCSRSCGAGGEPVPWGTLDAGVDADVPDGG